MGDVKTPDRGVVKVDLELVGNEPTWFLLRSDAHHDAVGSHRELEEKHLREALERKAWIADIGDLFDCMQGRYDKRQDRSALREEYRHGQYLDRLVEVAAERYGPYMARWFLMSPGNHETSVAKHNDTHLTERLYALLKPKAPHLTIGRYQGWISIQVRRRMANTVSRVGKIALAYHHGYGGAAPVTRGTIQTNRMGLAWPDANLVWSGHTHTDFYLSIARQRLNESDRIYRDEQIHIRSPGYKEDTMAGEGWAVEKGFMPQSLGAWWLKVWSEKDGNSYKVRYNVEPAR